MQKHAALVGKSGQGLDFARLIHRSNFRRLGNGNDSRLYMMRVIDAVVRLTDGFNRKLAVGHCDRKELASGKFLGRSAFVGVNVRGFTADDRVIGAGQRFQAQAIGRCAVKDKEHLDVRTEVPFEFLHCRSGVRIVSIADCVAAIGFRHGLQNFRMNSSIVVAGKTAGRFHLPKQCSRRVRVGHRPSDLALACAECFICWKASPTPTPPPWWYYLTGTG